MISMTWYPSFFPDLPEKAELRSDVRLFFWLLSFTEDLIEANNTFLKTDFFFFFQILGLSLMSEIIIFFLSSSLGLVMWHFQTYLFQVQIKYWLLRCHNWGVLERVNEKLNIFKISPLVLLTVACPVRNSWRCHPINSWSSYVRSGVSDDGRSKVGDHSSDIGTSPRTLTSSGWCYLALDLCVHLRPWSGFDLLEIGLWYSVFDLHRQASRHSTIFRSRNSERSVKMVHFNRLDWIT